MKAIAGRFGRLVVSLFVVTFLTFLLVNLLPGDPVRQIVGEQYASEENVEALREELGFDRPILVRYVDWLGDAVQGDLGQSYRTRQPVMDAIADRLPVTVELLVLSQVVALACALVVAPLAATRQGSLFDRLTTLGISASLSVPAYTLGIALIFIFGVRLQVLPATGWVPISESIPQNLKTMILPTVTLSLGASAVYAQVLRTEMVSTLQQDYIRLARARGLSHRYVITRHVLRPSSLPLLTLIGINTGALLGGAVLTETIFSLPGIGRLTVDAITNQDYILVQGIVLFITVAYVLANFIVDIVYALMDPRIRIRT